MKKTQIQTLGIFLVIIFLIPNSSLLGKKWNRNTAIFLEMNGAGLNYSINLDTRFKSGAQDGLGCRIGLGFDSYKYDLFDFETLTTQEIDLAKEFTLPIEVNYIYGKHRNGIELGIGLLLVQMEWEFLDDNYDFTISSFYLAEFSREQNKHVFGFLNIGYRFQTLSNGLILKANWTPLFTKKGYYAQNFGLSVGYKFY